MPIHPRGGKMDLNVSNSVINHRTALAQVRGMITSSWVSQAIYVAAELRIPDLLVNKAMKSDEIASALGAHAPSVRRFLRALTTIEICREREDGLFEITEQGRLLCSDCEDSLRSWALYAVGYLWPMWGHLLDSVKTGKSAREMVTGNKAFEHLEGNQEIAALFNQAMVEQTRVTANEVVHAYDFSGMKRIIDIGGGYGQLLATILLANPDTCGVLYDLPHAREAGQNHLEAAGLAERCDIISGSFFESVPEKGDIYLLKSVIHDWPDDPSKQILENCRKEMIGASKLLLIDRIYPDRLETTHSHQAIARSDLNMLIGPGGRERTESELRELLHATGLHINQIIPLEQSFHIIEAIPVV
jgi:hypothetical protein